MSQTLNQSQKQAIATLILVRTAARRTIGFQERTRLAASLLEAKLSDAIKRGNRMAETQTRIELERKQELLLEAKFNIVAIGKTFIKVADDCEQLDVPRADWLRALCVNESEWGSERMRKYGARMHDVVSVLKLENSATPYESPLTRPLAWCCDMVMLNLMQSNPTFGRYVHDKCNDTFDGAIGQWTEPTIAQRLGVSA
jgi:hypothetical protein